MVGFLCGTRAYEYVLLVYPCYRGTRYRYLLLVVSTRALFCMGGVYQ
jgi:hypothetical protein